MIYLNRYQSAISNQLKSLHGYDSDIEIYKMNNFESSNKTVGSLNLHHIKSKMNVAIYLN